MAMMWRHDLLMAVRAVARLLLMFGAFGVAAVEAGGVNLTPNSSLEQGDDDAPAAWRFYSWQDARGWWDAEFAHSGARGLGLAGLNGGWSTDVPVEAGKVYSISFWYRATQPDCRFVLYVRVPTGPRQMKAILYKPVPAVPVDQRARFVDGVYVGGADDAGWVLFEGGDFAPDEGVTSVNVLIKLLGSSADAKAWLDDVSVTARSLPVVPDTARLLRDLDGLRVWTDDVNRKIQPSRSPPTAPVDAVELSAARGEYESFQIAVTPRVDVRQVTWRCGNLSGPGDARVDVLGCRRVETVNIEQPLGPYGRRGPNPDPLTERLPCEVAAGVSQAFWFTLRVRQDQAPGEYRGDVVLTSAGSALCTVPVQLRVWDFGIPQRSTVDVRSSFRYGLVLPRETHEAEDVLRRYYRDFYKHRTRCSPGVRVRVQLRGDETDVDASEYLEHLRFMRDGLGARRFNIPSLWIGHRSTHKMPADASWQGRGIFADEALTRLNPEFESPFRSYMTQFLRELKGAGLFLAPVVRFFDEPNLEDGQTLAALRVLSELLLDIDPELTVAMTATYPHPRLIDVAKLWVLHTDAWDRNLRHIEAARRAGCRIYVYNNAVNHPEHRSLRVRLWPWLLRKYGVDGTYSWWGTVCWRGDMEDPWTAGKGSSGVLLYPPRSAAEHGPIDSIRWELFREGLEDYEYLHLATVLAAKLERAGQPALARCGRDALAGCLSLVQRWPNVRAANDEPYTLDVEAVAAARLRLAQAIEAMQAAPE